MTKKNQKILLIVSDIFFKGGIQRYARYQLKALRDIYGKNNVFIFSYCKKGENSFEEDINVEYFEEKKGIMGKINFMVRSLDFIKKKDINTVIINHINLSPIGFIAKKLFETQFFLNVYGLEIWSGLNLIKTVSLKNADKIIGDCKFILRYCKENLHVCDSKLNLLYDCVDIERFKPLPKNELLLNKYKIPKDKFVILTIGRLDRYKGHELIIMALKNLPEDIIYVIVGGGRLEGLLKTLVAELGLVDRVIFTGRVPEAELVSFYNICDVFALISKFDNNEGEGLPLALIEAAVCEKPIIAGNEDGSAEAVDEGKNGFLVSPKSLEDIKDKINLLYNDNKLRETMGKKGREKVIKEFSYENFKNRLERILIENNYTGK